MTDSTETPIVVPGAEGDALEAIVFSGRKVDIVPLPAKSSIILGRSEDSDLRIDAASVSRHHACLHRGPPLAVEDLESANGTLVRGKRISPHHRQELALNETLVLGDVQVVLRASHAAARPSRSSPARTMQEVWRLVGLAAPSDLSVLVLGETGVGKEVVARRLHERSKRAGKEMLAINCAALSQSTIESELFGHERGAFTGAATTKPGLLEAAHGSTAFLDEIGDLPLSAQAKLLRALDAGEVLRLGATRPRTIDVRIIAATHRDLGAMVEKGDFRGDLYFRLDGLTIHVPPLRARPEDIIPLAHTFAKGQTLSADATTALLRHSWPGNVRELKKVIERAVVLAGGGPIGAEHIVLGAPRSGEHDEGDLRDEVSRAEIEAIRRALAETGGNQTKAAEKLGISRRKLVGRLTRYGLRDPSSKR